MISLLRILAALVLSACLSQGARAETPPLKVVASFSILADLVRQVGGDRVAVDALVGPDGDAHSFEPTPADAAKLAGAQVIVVNGLGFEGWIDRLIRASGTKAALVTASRSVAGLKRADDDGHAHGADEADPHAWQDVGNAKLYVAAIRDALVAADPESRAGYETRAAAYLRELDALDAEIRARLLEIPAGARKVITTHDAFAYFAKAYGVRFIAPRGVSSAADASARDVGRIIRQIKAEKIPAVFFENISDPRQMERIAAETGARIGGTLASDALGPPGSPTGTYLGMMRSNLRTLASALTGRS